MSYEAAQNRYAGMAGPALSHSEFKLPQISLAVGTTLAR